MTILMVLAGVVGLAAWYFRRGPAQSSAQIGPAADLTPSWRGNPFDVGGRYRVLESPPLPSSAGFTPGEVLTYQGSGYSHYDEASIHYFLTRDGQTREWWLFDDVPIEHGRTLFRSEARWWGWWQARR